MAHARLQHLHRRVEPGRHIHFQNRRAVHIGVGLDGADQIENAVRRIEQRIHRPGSAQVTGEILQNHTGLSRLKKRPQRVEVGHGDTLLRELRGNLPGAFAGQFGEPGAQRLVTRNQGTRIERLMEGRPAQNSLLPIFDASNLFVAQAQVDELEPVLAVGAGAP